ncbi:MAG TPA: phosphoribosylanthranilate isomerase [Myxococcota bacterium]|nr:phosphoribosylanthranilate isomerase [Myxococcota bacterium]
MNIRIKICGITHPADAVLAAEAGADLIGLNFVADSPRKLALDTAAAISAAVAGRSERVGVFRDATPEEIDRVLRRVDLDRLQFHGSETEAQVEEVDLPVIKAIRGADAEAAAGYPGTILLLDHPDGGAGKGKAWEWSDAAPLIESGIDVILAGGLSPDNVGGALGALGDLLPWGVDVATGVEGSGYRKDAAKLAAFVQAVRKAEAGG